MQTPFKDNNRFSFLMNERKDFGKRDKERRMDNDLRNNDLRYNLRKEREREKEKDLKPVKEKQNIDLSSVVDFPELVKPKTTLNAEQDTTNFLDKLQLPVKIKPVSKDVVPLGWIKMKRSTTNHVTVVSNFFPVIDEDLAYDVINGLDRLHEKRTQEYINDWGYDEWDREFCFQNYDYGYFDRLDDIYEMNNPESEDGSDTENSVIEEEEYWKKY